MDKRHRKRLEELLKASRIVVLPNVERIELQQLQALLREERMAAGPLSEEEKVELRSLRGVLENDDRSPSKKEVDRFSELTARDSEFSKKSRIYICRACQLRAAGAKTRIAVPHTCGLNEEELRGQYFFHANLPKKWASAIVVDLREEDPTPSEKPLNQMTIAELSDLILENLKTRKGTDQEGRLALVDVMALKMIKLKSDE